MKNRVTFVLVTNLLTFILTVLMNQSGIISDSIATYAHLLWVIPLVLLIVVHITGAARELKGATEELRNEQEIRSNVSAEVVFLNRMDHFFLMSDGSCRLTYEFVLRVDMRSSINAIYFPIVSDLNSDGSDGGRAVELKALTVNGNAVATDDKFRIDRRVYYEDQPEQPMPMAFSNLRIPINRGDGERHRVEIEFFLPRTFERADQGEYFVVDIPYLTKNIEARFTAQQGNLEILVETPHKKGAVEAISDFNGAYSAFESNDALKALSLAKTNELKWKTNSPKLAHRYRIWFRKT